MQASEILEFCQENGVQLWVNGETLQYKPASKVPPELLPEIKEHKLELMELLAPEQKSLPAAFDRPPETREETVELMDFLANPVAFAQWFAHLMMRSDLAETDEGNQQ